MRKDSGLWLVLVIAAAIAGCSDDDAEPMSDAGPDGSAGTTKAGSGGGGGSRAPVAGSGGAGRDAGDPCSAYPSEYMPLWDAGEDSIDSARRATLAELCPQGCGGSLADFMARLQCRPVPDDGGVDDLADEFDGGIHTGSFWVRSEGCGSVQFSTVRPSWPRHHNFDADTGELIGYAQLDDVGTPLAGRSGSSECWSAAWIAGEIRVRCASEQLSLCEWR